MNNKYIYYTLYAIILLLLLAIFRLNSSNKCNIDNDLFNLTFSYEQQFEHANVEFHGDIYDFDNQRINLSEIIKTPKLVLRFRFTCQSCKQSQLDIIKNYERIVGAKNMILLITADQQTLNAIKKRDIISSDIYFVPPMGISLPIENKSSDYAFLIDSSLNINYLLTLKRGMTVIDSYDKMLVKYFDD